MMIINCKEIREQILDEVRKEVEALPSKPTLAIITIGNDDASKVYVRNKIKTAEGLGIQVRHVEYDENITQEDAQLAVANEVLYSDAVMLQLPIPKHLDEKILINLIPQCKDVDGLTDLNMGMLVNNHPYAIVPATVMGVYKIISHVLETGDFTGVNVTVLPSPKLIPERILPLPTLQALQSLVKLLQRIRKLLIHIL